MCVPPIKLPEVAAYEPWQERVLEEKFELDERRTKLFDFIGGEQFAKLPDVDRELLLKQRHLMSQLSAVLDARINRFTAKNEPVNRSES